MSEEKKELNPTSEVTKTDILVLGTSSETDKAVSLLRNIQNLINFYCEEEGLPLTTVVITKTGTLTAAGHFMKEQKAWKEKKDIFDYVKDPEKVADVFHHSQNLYKNVQKTDRFFGLKDIVDNTNLTYAYAQKMIDLIYAFGLLGKKKMGNRMMYKVFINQDERRRFIEQRIVEQKEILGQFEAMLEIEIATELKEPIDDVPADFEEYLLNKPETVGEINGKS